MQGNLFTQFFASICNSLTGFIPEEDRIHDQFAHFDADGYHYNDALHNLCCHYFSKEAPRVRVYFSDGELHHLTDCPFVARLKKVDGSRYKYEAYIYQVEDGAPIGFIESWARGKGFRDVAVFDGVVTTPTAAQNLVSSL